MNKYLFKNGMIIDGSGKASFTGDVLVEGNKIAAVSRKAISADGAKIIDCTGLAIAPGFIDAHSHHDFSFIAEKTDSLFESFLQQGITTFVCGNCGFGMAGFRKGSPYRHQVAKCFIAAPLEGSVDVTWNTWSEYMHLLEKKGIPANFVTLAAHGTTLGSILGMDTLGEGAVTPEVEHEVLDLLEEGLEDGCKGISVGLAYRPGNYTTKEQLKKIAALAAKHHKPLTVHREVEAVISRFYPDFNEPHDVRWLREFLENVAETGVSIHISHLLFAGRNTFPSYEPMHKLIDNYVAKGMDITFDMYSYDYGTPEIAVLLPADWPQNFELMEKDKALHDACEDLFQQFSSSIGIFSSDIFLIDPMVDKLEEYEGMYLDEMGRSRGMSDFDNIIDIYKRTDGHATVALGPYYSEEITLDQMINPKVMYMTDAWIIPGRPQNAASYGSMPRFLKLARETGNLSLEEVIHKMTGKTALYFDITSRGLLKNGYFADIVVFDPEKIAEKATPKNPSEKPVGIHKVFINGEQVVDEGVYKFGQSAGMVV
jgi:N-acyl-D-amino-acid deacylase